MKYLAIVVLCVLTAVGFGIAHDLVTARLCVEHYTVGHLRVFDTDDPIRLGIGWGIVATWSRRARRAFRRRSTHCSSRPCGRT